MATVSTVTIRSLSSPVGARVVTFTQVGSDRTAQANVTGAASDIYFIEIDNSANAEASYLKIYDQVGTPTHGTTDPVLVVRAAGSSSAALAIPGTLDFGNGLSMLVSTDGGQGTAGASLVVNSVSVVLLTT